MLWVPADGNGCRFGHHCRRRVSDSVKIERQIKLINYYGILAIEIKPSNSALHQPLRRVACMLHRAYPLNQHCWRGKRRHHGGVVCVLCCVVFVDGIILHIGIV
jgi:hypothetical protein